MAIAVECAEYARPVRPCQATRGVVGRILTSARPARGRRRREERENLGDVGQVGIAEGRRGNVRIDRAQREKGRNGLRQIVRRGEVATEIVLELGVPRDPGLGADHLLDLGEGRKLHRTRRRHVVELPQEHRRDGHRELDGELERLPLGPAPLLAAAGTQIPPWAPRRRGHRTDLEVDGGHRLLVGGDRLELSPTRLELSLARLEGLEGVPLQPPLQPPEVPQGGGEVVVVLGR
jgi:hypothetical protein